MFSRWCFSWVKKFFAFYFVIIGKCSTFASAFKEKLQNKIGAWRSWLAHLHGVQGVGSSSLLAPTEKKEVLKSNLFFYCQSLSR